MTTTEYTVTARLVNGLDQGARVLADIHGDTIKLRPDGFASLSAGRTFRFGSNRGGRVQRLSTDKAPLEFPLHINITASTTAEANSKLEVLQEATERARRWEERDRTGKPVYLRLLANDALGDLEPVIGYRARHLRLVGGAIDPPREPLAVEVMRGNMLDVTLNGVWYPEAEAREQVAWNGKGYLAQVRDGLMFSPAGTNLFSNPSFANASYMTSWAVAGTPTPAYEQVRDLARSLNSAVRVTSAGAQARLHQYVSLGSANYVASAYVRRIDGAAVGTADIWVTYGAAGTATTSGSVVPVPGEPEWYRVYGTFAHGASSDYVAFCVATGRSLIIDDCQLQTTPLTPLIRGDMLGCAWGGGGTPHASATPSSAVASQVDFATDTDNYVPLPPEYTIAVWVRPSFSYGTPHDHYILDYWIDANRSIRLLYDQANNYFKLVYTNSPYSSTLHGGTATFLSETPVMLAVTQDATGIRLYENGGSVGVYGGAYPFGASAKWYLGENKDAGNQFAGSLDGLRVWATALTGDQVAALYAAESPVKQAGDAVQFTPVLHTDTGDRATGGGGASKDATHATLVGVAGDVPAAVNLGLQAGATAYSAGVQVYVWRRALEDLYESGSQWYANIGGSALAGAWGEDVGVVAVGTVAVSVGTLTPTKKDVMRGDDVWLLRLAGTPGSALYAAPTYTLGTGGAAISGDWVSVPNTANVLTYAGQQLVWWEEIADENLPLIASSSATFGVQLKRTAGSASVLVDMFAVCPRPFMMLAGGAAGINRYLVRDRAAICYSTGGTLLAAVEVRGDELSLEPGQYNLLFAQSTDSNNVHSTDSATTWRKVGVRPRFAVYGY